jgi:hypothetical protein
MSVLYDSEVPIATAVGPAPEFKYIASDYSEEIQTAKLQAASVIEMEYFRTPNGSSHSGTSITLDPTKGDYIQLGGGLVRIEMTDPEGQKILGSIYSKKQPSEADNSYDSLRWRGNLNRRNSSTANLEDDTQITVPATKVKFVSYGCIRGDLLLSDGVNCQTVDTTSSVVMVSMPAMSFQSEGIIYTYDWVGWSNFSTHTIPEVHRYDGISAETLVPVPLGIDIMHEGDHVITTGAEARGYGYSQPTRTATNGAGMYEDSALIRLVVTEGDDKSWLWWLVGAAALATVVKKSM